MKITKGEVNLRRDSFYDNILALRMRTTAGSKNVRKL